ncbi:helveticin J family class III bacteriocin [Lactobacillus intestinalis]|uniref:helveticin J family class III bacteriocin n=1 Tax=Lactobacillus intestinalis TaxID=151781 RepID=UPI0012B960CC|nr:helveticin J family class III bacteriocin [Lactobacillus intestinalis]
MYKGHTYVLRGLRNDASSTVYLDRSTKVDLTDSAGGHTQTWEYAGSTREGNDNGWFIGTKGQLNDGYEWDIQLARIKFPTIASSNLQLVRLSHLNDSGKGFKGKYLYRTEGAVTPDYSKLMTVAVEKTDNGKQNAYFGLYNLNQVNSYLNGKQTSGWEQGHVVLGSLVCTDAFTIYGITNNIPSLQGFDIDNDYNIYISSELSPTTSGPRGSRQIIKIPWGESEPNNWYRALYDGYNSVLDISNHYTEFENIQVIDNNSLYLTVAYHNRSTASLTTDVNKIFKIQGFDI